MTGAAGGRLRAGLVGVGGMGLPLARRVADAGWTLRALARRPEVADEVAATGAVPVASFAEVADGADVVVLCVRTDAQVLEVALAPDGLLGAMGPGAVLVIHTTGSPATATTLGSAGEAVGVSVVDAPFSGAPSQVVAGNVTLLVGGSELAVASARHLVSAYGDPIYHLGPLGSGQRVKLLNNLLLAANAELAMDVVRLGDELGMDHVELVEVLLHCSGRSNALAMLQGGANPTEAVARLGGFLGKDIDVAMGVATDLGLDLGVLGRTAADARLRFDAAAAALAAPDDAD